MSICKRNSFNSLLIIIISCNLYIILPQYLYSQDTLVTNSKLAAGKEQKINDDPQKEYYRNLLKSSKEPVISKTFWQKIADNPASVLGVLGVFVAAMVTLLSFIFNYRATLRNQRDTQFYEALKRFGDKDSPAIRSSAAGILSQMATQKRFKLTRIAWEMPYFQTILNQLNAGLLLEENHVVLTSIRDAIISIALYNSEVVVKTLYQSNLQLQGDMVNVLIQYRETLKSENVEDFCKLVTASTGYQIEVVSNLIKRFEKQFLSSFDYNSRRHKIMEIDKQEQLLMMYENNLKIISVRLSASIAAIGKAIYYSIWTFGRQGPFQKIWWKIIDGFQGSTLDLRNAFLQKIKLDGVNYSSVTTSYGYDQKLGKPVTITKREEVRKVQGVCMEKAQLQNASFTSSNLDKWDLTATYLHGAKLNSASLVDTRFYDAHIDSETDFKDSNWWKANFYKPNIYEWSDNREWDTDLLDQLFGRYGEEKIENPHRSVVEYMDARKD